MILDARVIWTNRNQYLFGGGGEGLTICGSGSTGSLGGSPGVDHGWSQGSVLPPGLGFSRLIARGFMVSWSFHFYSRMMSCILLSCNRVFAPFSSA
jgi:hypothetical protein